jgi:hypothetical protein
MHTMIGQHDGTEGQQLPLDDQTSDEPSEVEAVRSVTAAGFEARRGARLIEGRRPATWLEDAIAREHEITRRMGLLDPKPPRGVVVSG